MKRIRIEEIKGNSLEKVLLEPMSSLRLNDMDKDLVGILMSMMTMSEEDTEGMREDLVKEAWSLPALTIRIDSCLSISVTTKVQMFLTFLTEGNIGSMIMYAYYLQYWAHSKGIREVDLKMFCERIFPLGFFYEEDLQKVWEHQKGFDGKYSFNLIDKGASTESIQYMDEFKKTP